MMPAQNKGLGGNFCFPDILPTVPPIPPAPIPYPNLAMSAMAVPFSPNIYVGFMPALNMGAVIPMTSGDEPGIAGGRIKLPAMYTMGNPVIFINSMPAVNLLCPTTGNAMNAFLGMVVIPSITTTLYTDRAALELATNESTSPSPESRGGVDPRPPELSVETLRGLVQAVSSQPSHHLDPPLQLFEPSPGIVHVRLTRVVSNASLLLFNALRRHDCSIRALVLDLRGCPGGDLDACLQLADDFLPPDTLVAWRDDPDGDCTALRARQDDPYPYPLAVLVDGDTASAAEILAGSLQAHGRALLIGERTCGKATAQAVCPGPESAHYCSVASFRLPDGSSFENRGLQPDAPGGLEEAVQLLHASLPT